MDIRICIYILLHFGSFTAIQAENHQNQSHLFYVTRFLTNSAQILRERYSLQYFLMKNLTVFLVIGLLIWSSYSYIGFAVVGPFTASAFTCLLSSVPNSAQYAIIRAYQNSHSPAGIDPNALQTFTNAFAAGYQASIYVELCRGINATSQINLVQNEIFTPWASDYWMHFNDIFYIKVEPSTNPDCSWESYSHSDNCNFLKQAAMAVGNNHWMPGVFTTAHIWQQFFGSSCDTFVADVNTTLWYANYDNTGNVISTQSYDDYIPFGGWTLDWQISGKQVAGNVTVPLLCGSKKWHAFVDYFWYP